MTIIIFLLILAVLILVHEFGHFIIAKKNNIRVDEFGLGFPPRLIRLFKKGETEYTLNLIPFGGFVKIFGESPSEDSNDLDKERSLISKPKRVQALVLAGGILFNLLFAWILLSIVFMFGMPNVEGEVVKLGFFSSIFEGLKITLLITKETVFAFGTLIWQAVTGSADLTVITGPIGIVGLVGQASSLGFIYILIFTAIISINLAVINLVPFPALDGGRLFFLLIEYIKGTPIKPKIFQTINTFGFLALIILMFIVTYNDIINLL